MRLDITAYSKVALVSLIHHTERYYHIFEAVRTKYEGQPKGLIHYYVSTEVDNHFIATRDQIDYLVEGMIG